MQPKNKKWSCLITQFLSTAHKEKLFCSQRLVFLSSCGKRAEPNWVWTIQEMLKECEWPLDCHCFPCKVSVAASLAGVKPVVEQVATQGVMRKPKQHQGRDMRWSSCWAKKGRKAGCSSSGAWGRQSSPAAWLSPACQTSHVFMRLLGSKWFLGKVRVLLTQKK